MCVSVRVRVCVRVRADVIVFALMCLCSYLRMCLCLARFCVCSNLSIYSILMATLQFRESLLAHLQLLRAGSRGRLQLICRPSSFQCKWFCKRRCARFCRHFCHDARCGSLFAALLVIVLLVRVVLVRARRIARVRRAACARCIARPRRAACARRARDCSLLVLAPVQMLVEHRKGDQLRVVFSLLRLCQPHVLELGPLRVGQ